MAYAHTRVETTLFSIFEPRTLRTIILETAMCIFQLFWSYNGVYFFESVPISLQDYDRN